MPTQEIDFEETIQDILRFGYVSLFHKVESYLADVLQIADSLFKYSNADQESVSAWAKKKLGFDFRHWRQFHLIHKINYISNCVKHEDGYAKLPHPPIEFVNADQTNRIRLSLQEFKTDCERLNEVYLMYLKTAFLLRQYQYAELMLADPDRAQLTDRDKVIQESSLDKLRDLVTSYIELIRNK